MPNLIRNLGRSLTKTACNCRIYMTIWKCKAVRFIELRFSFYDLQSIQNEHGDCSSFVKKVVDYQIACL